MRPRSLFVSYLTYSLTRLTTSTWRRDGNFLDRFVGPSLLIYNNSIFTESDKKNIMNLGDSLKKNDPLSVGRFGLGFNCSYHLSGESQFLLLIDHSKIRRLPSASLQWKLHYLRPAPVQWRGWAPLRRQVWSGLDCSASVTIPYLPMGR